MVRKVLMETGIASTPIRKTVELGGDRPIITIVLLNVVTAFIFTAMMGAGPVIAIGVIVLPILMSLGILKQSPVHVHGICFRGHVSESRASVLPHPHSSCRQTRCRSSHFHGMQAIGILYALAISVVTVSL